MPQTQEQTAPVESSQPQPIDGRSLNLPNMITISRLILSFVLFAMISFGESWNWVWIWSAGLFSFAAATDFLDGYIARKYQLVTTLGRILDPFVDKIIICGSFIFLLGNTASGVNAWMVIAVIGREMFVTGLRSFLEQAGHDFSAAWIGKIKMTVQCAAVVGCLICLDPDLRLLSYADSILIARDVLLWSCVAITLYSGLAYAWRGFQMLSAPQES